MYAPYNKTFLWLADIPLGGIWHLSASPLIRYLSLLFLFLHLVSALADETDSNPRYKSVPQELSNDKNLEFWGYENYQGNSTYTDTLKIRYYTPLNIDSWRGRMRIDTSVVSSNTRGQESNNSGQFSAGNTMLTIWGQDSNHLPNINATVGGRLVLPFGNNGQWAIGPQIRWLFKPTEGVSTPISDFSPLLRYMYGFNTKNNSININPNQPALQRTLQIYPTVGLSITPETQLRIWDENGIMFNTAGGSWFVPLDGMITHRLSREFLFAIGVSKQLVDTYKQYNWSTYGKLSYTF